MIMMGIRLLSDHFRLFFGPFCHHFLPFQMILVFYDNFRTFYVIFLHLCSFRFVFVIILFETFFTLFVLL